MILEKKHVSDIPDGAVCYIDEYSKPYEGGVKFGRLFLSNSNNHCNRVMWRTRERLTSDPHYQPFIEHYAYGWWTDVVWVEKDELGEIE